MTAIASTIKWAEQRRCSASLNAQPSDPEHLFVLNSVLLFLVSIFRYRPRPLIEIPHAHYMERSKRKYVFDGYLTMEIV